MTQLNILISFQSLQGGLQVCAAWPSCRLHLVPVGHCQRAFVCCPEGLLAASDAPTASFNSASLSHLVHHGFQSSLTQNHRKPSIRYYTLDPAMQIFAILLLVTLCLCPIGQAQPLPKAGHQSGEFSQKGESHHKQSILVVELEPSRSLTHSSTTTVGSTKPGRTRIQTHQFDRKEGFYWISYSHQFVPNRSTRSFWSGYCRTSGMQSRREAAKDHAGTLG